MPPDARPPDPPPPPHAGSTYLHTHLAAYLALAAAAAAVLHDSAASVLSKYEINRKWFFLYGKWGGGKQDKVQLRRWGGLRTGEKPGAGCGGPKNQMIPTRRPLPPDPPSFPFFRRAAWCHLLVRAASHAAGRVSSYFFLWEGGEKKGARPGVWGG